MVRPLSVSRCSESRPTADERLAGNGRGFPSPLPARKTPARGVVPTRPNPPAAGVRRGAAEIQSFDRRTVVGVARGRPQKKELQQRHRPLKDVPAGESEATLEV